MKTKWFVVFINFLHSFYFYFSKVHITARFTIIEYGIQFAHLQYYDSVQHYIMNSFEKCVQISVFLCALNLRLAQQIERSPKCVTSVRQSWGHSPGARGCPFYCKESTITQFQNRLDRKNVHLKYKIQSRKMSSYLHF